MPSTATREPARVSPSPLSTGACRWMPRTVRHLMTTGLMAMLVLPAAYAAQAGRGHTAGFEVRLMRLVIDHHFSALRMTELAAGTDPQRSGHLSSNEGTSPTPGFPATHAKAALDEIKSMARMENRAQREQIMHPQMLLRDWYGVAHEPRIREDAQQMLTALEQAQPGASFDRAFLETFSRHHFSLLQPMNACITGADRLHQNLIRLCKLMWHEQTSGIDEMRELLETRFGIVDYQPFRGERPLQQ